ncbi:MULTISPECIES: hypothetical protein [unclassified Flavobacterium]|uniref:hypothetical protein n=1 Tax=Flavobacterium sp. N2270 TaxID=2986831 RepID=UPI00222538A7|nr:hypothetical protein [Flavobacterium sp. N2270]
MRNSIVLVFVILVSNITYAQTKADSITSLDLDKIAQVNQGESYVTFPFDVGNLEPLMFEANVSPNFKIRERKDSRLMAVLTSQIIIRMYDEYSYPVRTPSYIPQIAFYFLTGHKDAANKLTLFGKIAHHSNGQDGNFYTDDGKVNLQSGNFATNYLELGFLQSSYSQNLKAFKFIKSSVEIHPKSWMLEELHGQYSGLRWHNTFLAYKLPMKTNLVKSSEQRANFSVKAETTLMLDNINNWDTFNSKRINASLIVYYHPKFLEDIGFFVQFYQGMDYYNIYFQHQISSIRFGIMTETLRF